VRAEGWGGLEVQVQGLVFRVWAFMCKVMRSKEGFQAVLDDVGAAFGVEGVRDIGIAVVG